MPKGNGSATSGELGLMKLSSNGKRVHNRYESRSTYSFSPWAMKADMAGGLCKI